MNPKVLDKYLIEYQVNVSLWKHDDDLRQKRNALFLTVNTILLSVLALSLRLTLSDDRSDAVDDSRQVITLIIPIFGMISCAIWFLVQRRNLDYVKFRRFQLRNLEKKIGHVDTFTNQHLALDDRTGAKFGKIGEEFVGAKLPKKTSTRLELYLPVFWGVLWFLTMYIYRGSWLLFFTV